MLELRLSEIGLGSDRPGWRRRCLRRLAQPFARPADARLGTLAPRLRGDFWIAARQQPSLPLDMIHRENEIVKADDEVWPGDVGARMRGHVLDMVAQAIAEIAGQSGLEWRHARRRLDPVARAQRADHVE